MTAHAGWRRLLAGPLGRPWHTLGFLGAWSGVIVVSLGLLGIGLAVAARAILDIPDGNVALLVVVALAYGTTVGAALLPTFVDHLYLAWRASPPPSPPVRVLLRESVPVALAPSLVLATLVLPLASCSVLMLVLSLPFVFEDETATAVMVIVVVVFLLSFLLAAGDALVAGRLMRRRPRTLAGLAARPGGSVPLANELVDERGLPTDARTAGGAIAFVAFGAGLLAFLVPVGPALARLMLCEVALESADEVASLGPGAPPALRLPRLRQLWTEASRFLLLRSLGTVVPVGLLLAAAMGPWGWDDPSGPTWVGPALMVALAVVVYLVGPLWVYLVELAAVPLLARPPWGDVPGILWRTMPGLHLAVPRVVLGLLIGVTVGFALGGEDLGLRLGLLMSVVFLHLLLRAPKAVARDAVLPGRRQLQGLLGRHLSWPQRAILWIETTLTVNFYRLVPIFGPALARTYAILCRIWIADWLARSEIHDASRAKDASGE